MEDYTDLIRALQAFRRNHGAQRAMESSKVLARILQTVLAHERGSINLPWVGYQFGKQLKVEIYTSLR